LKTSASTAVILVNLGTPDAATPNAVRRYLKEFLSDVRVIDIARPLWWLILNGIILNVRPRKVAKLYEAVWDEDSPIRKIGYAQAQRLQERLTNQLRESAPLVKLGMTYGNPSLDGVVDELIQQGISRCLVLPLYPQYSATTTAATFDKLAQTLKKQRNLPTLIFNKDYHQHPHYITALANSVLRFWHQHGKPQRLIFSFHGIPKRYADLGDPYPVQCHATAAAVAQQLNLAEHEWSVAFQSRFGREEWLQPYTDVLLHNLPQQGVKKVHLICPAFASDCLETLEEIAIQGKEMFLESGGEEYRYIPALNDHPDHIELLCMLVNENLNAEFKK